MVKLIEYEHIGRPVRVLTAEQLEVSLALDLSRGHMHEGGVDWWKAMLMLNLPLFRIAIDGTQGMCVAERIHQQQRRMAA